MASYVHVFTPLRIGRLTSKNRVECAPAIPFLASEHYFVTRELIEWYRRIAKGGAGVVTIGETLIDYEDARRNGRANILLPGRQQVDKRVVRSRGDHSTIRRHRLHRVELRRTLRA